MLIRLCNNATLNPHLIDKLIVIRGLPHDWVFKTTPQGEELLAPWQPDVDANIPESIRHLTKQIEYCRWYQDVRHYDRTYNGFWDTRKTWGVRLDFNYGPAQQMWERIVEFVEGTLPRTERMPVPVLVAVDQKSGFDTHTPRRNAQGHLELVRSQIPVIDLTIYQKLELPTVTAASTPVAQIEMKTNVFLKCPDCNYETEKERALATHRRFKHKTKEKVTV